MEELITATKLLHFIEKTIIKKFPSLMNDLLQGDLLNFEQALSKLMSNLYTEISSKLLEEAAIQLSSFLKKSASAEGLGKFQERSLEIQISNGSRINVPSIYACKVTSGYSKSRHLLANHWAIISNASPAYVDKACLSVATCPSYEVANELLKHFGTNQGISRLRKLTNAVATHCKAREVDMNLAEGENMIGKCVLIGSDGGRTRTRLQNDDATYETPWCEPKMFVIHVIDEDGALDKKHLPIYGCRFGEEDMLRLLKEYLQVLGIDQCKQVQLVADGAPWIWNNLPPMLEELGVEEHKVVLTLDYYHAISYVHQLVDKLPKRYSDSQKEGWRTKFKKWLWDGKSDLIVEKCKTLFKRPTKLIKRWMNYLDKHLSKTQYAGFKENKLMCGSGIIESGIRRIVNLRFKNPSTFWDKGTVEKLFFFRSTFLSFRWNNFMKNYISSFS